MISSPVFRRDSNAVDRFREQSAGLYSRAKRRGQVSNVGLPPGAVHHLVEGKQTNSASPFSHYGQCFLDVQQPTVLFCPTSLIRVCRDASPVEYVLPSSPLTRSIMYAGPVAPSFPAYPSCFSLLSGRKSLLTFHFGASGSDPHFSPSVTEFGRWQRDGKPIDFDAGVRGRRQPPDLSCQEFHDPRSGHGRFGQTRRPL